jgi:hypothetical protein
MTRTSLTRDDVLQIKELLEKFEELKAAHVFTPEDAEAIKRIVDTFDKHGPEIEAIILKEQASQLWAKLRLKYWSVVKWFLGAFLTLVAAIQGWQQIIEPLIARWQK